MLSLTRPGRNLARALVLLLCLALLPEAGLAQGVQTGPSGQPLPRFVSLKSSAVNVRRGPGKDYPVAWRFVRAGLPVEIIQEFDTWRKIRDSDGAEGWIHQSLLSGRRTAIVAPWADGERFQARAEPGGASQVTAILESRVIADVLACEGGWCSVRGDGFQGWMPQETLWGVYPNEKVSG